jgi:hypothetical protein
MKTDQLSGILAMFCLTTGRIWGTQIYPILNNSSPKLITMLTAFTVGAGANAAEYFWLTEAETPLKGVEASYPNVDNPAYSPTLITVDGNNLLMNRNNCNVDIEKIAPFTKSRAFMDIVDDAGGEAKFNTFLKTKLRTDPKDWGKKYQTKPPAADVGGPGCEILNGMIFRGKNEIIITNTNYFLRFSKGTKPNPPKNPSKASSDFDG